MAPRAPQHTATERAVLRRITPPRRAPAVVHRVLSRVQESLDAHGVSARVVLGGSTAKGTNLRGDHDIDCFVRFPKEVDGSQLSDLLGRALTAAYPTAVRVHGSRDYFQVAHGGFTFEFVPVLDVSTWSEAQNVTDMSPLHVGYVQGHLLRRPWLADEIRLTKQFCKSARVYGAESYIGGFSGHVIDLLNILYGGFRPLLVAATAWKSKTILDPEGTLTDPLSQLNRSKTRAPLVIVDPVQADRNSAAALTRACYDAFKERAAAYLAARPTETKAFFTVQALAPEALGRIHPDARILVITLTPQQGKKDVSGAKCAKVLEHLTQELNRRSFAVLGVQWEFTPKRASIHLALPRGLLPSEERIIGPPVHRTTDVAKFTAVHTTTLTVDGQVHAIERRRYRDPLPFVKEVLTTTYVRSRVDAADVREHRERRERRKKR